MKRPCPSCGAKATYGALDCASCGASLLTREGLAALDAVVTAATPADPWDMLALVLNVAAASLADRNVSVASEAIDTAREIVADLNRQYNPLDAN